MEIESLSDLAATSLPTLSGGIATQQPRQNWSRPLTVLHAENREIQQSFQTTQGGSLFGDAASVGKLISSLATPAAAASKPMLPLCNVEEYLRRDRNATLDRILNRELEQVNRDIETKVEEQSKRDWEAEKGWWMKDIIGKDYVGKASLSASARKSMVSNLARWDPSQFTALGADVDLVVVEQHMEIVKNTLSKKTGNTDEVIAQFQHCARTLPPQQGYYYGLAWRLLASMLVARSTSPIERVIGSLDYLSKQFRENMANRVQASGFDTQGDMIRTVQKYVDLEFGANATIWHMIYFALRSGDAVSATQMLQFARAGDIETAASRAIEALGQRQGRMGCLWETRSVALTSHETQELEMLYDSLSVVGDGNAYKLGSLALLCGKRMLPSGNGMVGFGTIEDYIFGCQWKVIHSSDPMVAVAKLGDHIRGFEASYFDGLGGGKWSQTLALLLTQQFSSALVSLTNTGSGASLLQAAHLVLCILSVDEVVGDVGSSSGQDESNSVAHDIIVAYAAYLQTSLANGSTSALMYLLKIKESHRRKKEIATLVGRSYANGGNLAGQLSADGIRQEAELDKHLPYNEASDAIAAAAEDVRKAAADRASVQNSLNLFMLAGRYSSVIHVLNQMMSPPSDVNSERTYWRQQSEMLYSTHLSKQSIVLNALEKEGQRHLVETNRRLALLCLFFENLVLKQTDSCMDILTSLQLLPRTSEDVAGKVASAKDLDEPLRASIPAVLTGAMECLYNQYRYLKTQSVAQSPTSKARLMKISEEGRALSTFAGLLGIDRSARDIMSRFEAHMM